MKELRGICPVLPVPFLSECEIDFASFEHAAAFALSAGVSALAVLGLGSESWKLTESERGLIVEAAVRHSAGAVPVVAGIGAESAHCAVQHAQQACRAGASIMMVTPPLNFRLSEDAIFDYYRAISDSCEASIMIQDTSSVGVNQMSAALIARMADAIANVRYAKIETVPAGPKISLLKKQTELILFGGNGALNMFDALDRGASGMMPGAEIVDRFVRIWCLYRDGQVAEAAAAHRAILPLLVLEGQGAEAFVAIAKQVLYLRGLITSPMVRRPASYVVDNIAARQIAALLSELA
jgi:2-keto-3-deoxy-L-arabinonate dehydratase